MTGVSFNSLDIKVDRINFDTVSFASTPPPRHNHLKQMDIITHSTATSTCGAECDNIIISSDPQHTLLQRCRNLNFGLQQHPHLSVAGLGFVQASIAFDTVLQPGPLHHSRCRLWSHLRHCFGYVLWPKLQSSRGVKLDCDVGSCSALDHSESDLPCSIPSELDSSFAPLATASSSPSICTPIE